MSKQDGAQAHLVELSGIVKDFPGVRALDRVDFDLRPGEVHCLMGENGAGKSTLIKILTGVHQPDAGGIRIHGRRFDHLTPRLVHELGITAIYQDFDLVPALTVAENVFLGRERLNRYGRVDREAMNQATEDLFRRLQMEVDPEMLVANVGVGMQQMTEIVKALSRRAEIVIMDEPTTSLNETEVAQLFNTIRRLRGQGIAVIYISHRLEEVFAIGDRATVLRDGKRVGSQDLADLTSQDLIAMMVGRTLHDKYYKENVPIGEPVLSVDGLQDASGMAQDISFALRAGEILGFAGIRGSGFKEVPRIIGGVVSASGGTIRMRGQQVSIVKPSDAISAGIGYLPEDRKSEGLILSLPVKDNIVLPILGELARNGVADAGRERRVAEEYVDNLDIRTPSINQRTQLLSGGNQQKVVLAKWLASRSQVLLLDEPTHGIDVGAKIEMYRLIARFVHDGGAVILVSSEIGELMAIADRILVLRDGCIVGELDPQTATEKQVLHLATLSERDEAA
jgi:ribose transport system ATP-binding protein